MEKQKNPIRSAIQQLLAQKIPKHVLILGTRHIGTQKLVADELSRYVKRTRKLLQINLDYFCWSPDHFMNKWHDLLLQTAGSNKEIKWFFNDEQKLFQNAFGALDKIALELNISILLVITELQGIQTLFHYRKYNDVFQDLLIALKNSSTFSTLIIGRPPHTREQKFKEFCTNFIGEIIKVTAMSKEVFSGFFNFKHNLDQTNLELLYNISGGALGYVPGLTESIKSSARSGCLSSSKLLSTILRDLCNESTMLYQYCSYRYYYSISKVKGYGSLRSVLSAISCAEKNSLNLTELSLNVHKTPAAVKDYLNSLCDAGLVTRKKRNYSISDPLIKFWIILQENNWFKNDLAESTERMNRLEQKIFDNFLSQNKLRFKETRPSKYKTRGNSSFLEFD